MILVAAVTPWRIPAPVRFRAVAFGLVTARSDRYVRNYARLRTIPHRRSAEDAAASGLEATMNHTPNMKNPAPKRGVQK